MLMCKYRLYNVTIILLSFTERTGDLVKPHFLALLRRAVVVTAAATAVSTSAIIVPGAEARAMPADHAARTSSERTSLTATNSITAGLLTHYETADHRRIATVAGTDSAATSAAPEGAALHSSRGFVIAPSRGRLGLTHSGWGVIDVPEAEMQSGVAWLQVEAGQRVAMSATSYTGSGEILWYTPGSVEPLPVPRSALSLGDLNEAGAAARVPMTPRDGGSLERALKGGERNLGGFLADWGDDPLDTDRDGIENDWELNGYTVEQHPSTGEIAVVKWEDAKHDGVVDPWGRPYERYVSSPLKASTNDDPWSDFQKATHVQLDPGIAPEARHPMVSAAPEVEIDMTRFRLIPDTQWSDSKGGENVQGVTQTSSTSTSRSDTVGGEVSCSASLLDFGCSVSANYSYSSSRTAGYEEASSNSSSEQWNSMLSGANASAAILLPNVFYHNVGTAPLTDAYPLFTVKLGDESLTSATSNAANRLASARPGEAYPRGGTALAFEKVNDFGTLLKVDGDAYKRLQKYASSNEELKLVTTGLDAFVTLIDTTGAPYQSSQKWEDRMTMMRSTNASLIVEKAGGGVVKRRIAAPGSSTVERTIPQLTLGEALALTHGAVKTGGTWTIDGVPITSDRFTFTADAVTSAAIAKQGPRSIFDVKLQAGMNIALKEIVEHQTPDPDPEPDPEPLRDFKTGLISRQDFQNCWKDASDPRGMCGIWVSLPDDVSPGTIQVAFNGGRRINEYVMDGTRNVAFTPDFFTGLCEFGRCGDLGATTVQVWVNGQDYGTKRVDGAHAFSGDWDDYAYDS